jgi:conjugal transfer pilus assembly protein TraI
MLGEARAVFARWLGVAREPAARSASHWLTGAERFTDPEDPLATVPRYPPFDRGIPDVEPARIVASQTELIDRIFRSAGLPKPAFDTHLRRPIERLAAHVHLLPATASSHHRGAGGLFRMSLEVALHTLQAGNAGVFPIDGGGERRFEMQPRWVAASMLAGLCSQLFRAVSAMAVLDGENRVWQPLLTSLHAWCQDLRAEVYFVRWQPESLFPGGAIGASAYLLNQIVPAQTLQWLGAENNSVVAALTAAVSGVQLGPHNPISRLMAPVITRVIEDDLRRNALNFEHHQIGVQLEPHLVDAMRRLWRAGVWMANTDGGVVFIGEDGVFLDWTPAAEQVVGRLESDNFAGVPRDPDTLADLLTQAGVFDRGAAPEQRYTSIVMPETGEVRPGCVRLAASDLIFPDGLDLEGFARGRRLALPASGPVTADAPEPARAKVASRATEPMANGAPLQSEGAAPQVTRPAGRQERDGRRRATGAEGATAPGSPPEPRETSDGAASAETLLARLTEANAGLLRGVVRAAAAGTTTGLIALTPNGVAVSHEALTAHGCDAAALLEELLVKNWLWIDRNRPTRKVHAVEIDGATHRVMIVRPEIARAIGLWPVSRDAPSAVGDAE